MVEGEAMVETSLGAPHFSSLEWGEAASSSRVATMGQIQILIPEYGNIQHRGATAAADVSCYPLAITVCTWDVKT